MPRTCELTGKSVMFGNNVSHANNKSSRTFAINTHKITFYSNTLSRNVSFLLSRKGSRTIAKFGGLDEFLESVPYRKISGRFIKLKKEFEKKSKK